MNLRKRIKRITPTITIITTKITPPITIITTKIAPLITIITTKRTLLIKIIITKTTFPLTMISIKMKIIVIIKISKITVQSLRVTKRGWCSGKVVVS